MRNYHDGNLKNIDFKNLFCFNKKIDTKIDLNYATSEVWMLLLGVDKERADFLSSGMGTYYKLEDIPLSDDEKSLLNKFKTSMYEPYIDVNIEVLQGKQHAIIRFEYDLIKNKGSNFVYKI